MDDDKVNQFLNRISQLESSRGKNVNHKMINNGLQAGQRAIGQYGLLNNTIQEVLNRKKNEQDLSPELEALQGQDQETVRQDLTENPEHEQAIAKYLANYVLNKQDNDDEAAYSWNMGHNLKPESITPEKMQNSDYVQKYLDLKDQEDEQNKTMQGQAQQRALELLQSQNPSPPMPATLQNPQSLENVDKAIKNMQGTRTKKKEFV